MNTTNGIQVLKKTITPKDAELLLSKNEGNRNLSDRSVQFLYNQMVDGNWLLTADTIKIGKNGRLLDGQHRLRALLKYGKPLDMFVAEGLDNKVFTVLDTGKNRTAGDVLSMTGYKSANNLASSIRAILLFKAGAYSMASGGRGRGGVTNKLVLEYAEKHPELHEVVNYIWGIYKQFRFLGHSSLVMLYWILSRKNQTQADIFFEKYATGIDLGESSPIRHLRERLLKDSMNKSKLSLRDKIALFIFAWNAFVQKKKMQQLTLQKNYVFPKPI
jgi:hypothetical protein